MINALVSRSRPLVSAQALFRCILVLPACSLLSMPGAMGAPVQNIQEVQAAASNSFTNPLLPSGADPWVISYKGIYYYTQTTGTNLTLWSTPDITDLAHAAKRVVWTPPSTGPFSHDIWAPELHRFGKRWYLYFAADGGSNDSHRIFVLENGSEDPLQGVWTMKGQVTDTTDHWAIDPTAVEIKGQRYLLWSGWQGDANGEQDIFIAHLKNPWTIDSERSLLSYPKFPWEHVGDLPGDPTMPHVNVNEGPEILIHQDHIFLVYSASACWTDYYALGVLEADLSSDLLSPSSWKKFDHPFFRQAPGAGVFGPGHNSFFTSSDGKQDWILYHANPETGAGCGDKRSPRAQPFTWNADGTPNFGQPVGVGEPLERPSR